MLIGFPGELLASPGGAGVFFGGPAGGPAVSAAEFAELITR